MNARGPQEHDLRRDWDQLARTAGVIFRYPRTIAFMTVLTAVIAWVFTMTRDPMFRASATLKLEDPLERNPALQNYNIPLGVIEVEEALALLRSEALMAEVVAAPTDGELATPEHPEWNRHLGLTTLVDDETNQPLKGTIDKVVGGRSPDFRTYAFVDSVAPGAPNQVRLRFLDEHRVVVSLIGRGPGIEWESDQPTLVGFREGKPIRAHGLTFRLALRGTVDDRTFVMRHMQPETAVRTFMPRLRTNKMADQKGLVQISIEDLEPERAAAVANALCQAYLNHDRQSVLDQANRNVELIGNNLESVQGELGTVEAEIARILSMNTDAIDPDASSGALIARKNAGQTQLAKLSMLAEQFRAMITAVEAGNRAEVSRIGPELDDKFIQKMLEDVVILERDLNNTGREGFGDYRKSIQILRDQKSDEADAVRARYEALADIVAKARAGDMRVLARLGNELAKDGSVAVDWISRQYLTELANEHGKLIELQDEYVDEYELIVHQKERIRHLEQTILGFLASQLEGMRQRVDDATAQAERWKAIVAQHPLDERKQIELGLQGLWGRIEEGIRSRLRGVDAELLLVQEDLELVERRLASLPLAEQSLAAPSRKRDSLRVKVDEWQRDMAQAEFAREGVLDAARVLDTALPPSGRFKPVPTFGVLVGLVLGFILSVTGSIVFDRFRGKPRSQPDLEEATGLAVCAVVPASPRAASKDRGWLALREDPDGPVAEAYRTLRSRLRGLEVEGRALRTVAVTSCLAGEGKTAVNAGLATAFAMEGHRVLLIDANLRNPRLASAYGCDPMPGLAEALDGRRHWMQCRQATPHRGLDLLTAGDHYYSPGDLLGSVEMRELLDDVTSEYDLVVLDLPPAVGLPDVAAVAPMIDALLVLQNVNSGPTTTTMQRVVRELIRGGASLAGTVQVSAPRRLLGRRLTAA